MPLYETYGIAFTSSIRFQSPLLTSEYPATLEILEIPAPLSLAESHPFIPIEERHWNTIAPVEIRRSGDADVEIFGDGAQIWLSSDRIIYAHGASRRTDLMDVRLIGVGFAWWLLRRGRIPLHAGALSLGGDIVLFTAESGMGKSSLMSAFVAAQHPLVADDFVAVHRDPITKSLMASSAYPQMRLWGNSVSQFFGDPQIHPTVFEDGEKRRVHIPTVGGYFRNGTYPINRIYLLERRESKTGDIIIEKLNGHEAFMLMLSNIIMGAIIPAEYIAAIWDTVQAGAEQIPFYRLSYPSGWEHLEAVQNVITAGSGTSVALTPSRT